MQRMGGRVNGGFHLECGIKAFRVGSPAIHRYRWLPDWPFSHLNLEPDHATITDAAGVGPASQP